MRQLKIFVFMLLLPLISSCNSMEGGTSKKMQEDFDRIRLDSILIIDNLVKEYKEKTGRYPFENYNTTLPIVITIASDEQIENDKGRSNIFVDLNTRSNNGKKPQQPKSIKKLSLTEFKKELENGIGKSVTIPFDPQKVPVNKPSLYYYVYYLGVYDVTAFLHNDLSFVRPLSEFNNKITIGSVPYPTVGIWSADELKKQTEFKSFFTAPFNKGGYTIKTALMN